MKLSGLKSTLTSSVLACSLALMAFAPGSRAIAQNPSLQAVADIPFDFHCRSEVMPAGKYDILQLSDHLLIVRGVHQTRSEMMLANNTEARKPFNQGKLVFHRYGNQYYLYQVWSSGKTSGFEFPKSRAEKETLRAGNDLAPSTSELALIEVSQR